MKYFTTIHDIKDPAGLITEAINLKKKPFAFSEIGKGKTIGLIFMNPSLRTRLSTQKAALNLGMNVITMNIGQEGWALEYNGGAVMNGTSVEHVKDAAAMIGIYCDIVAIRCFASLTNKEDDYKEKILLQFMKYCNKPLISLESATLHPLQSLADCITIEEHKAINKKAKVVLSWAPHVKPLPQAVANSFSEWMLRSDVEFVITHPEGYELCPDFIGKAPVVYDQQKALEASDFVYVKNWSSYNEYGSILPVKEDWLLNQKKMSLTNNAYLMHCLPVRRNVEVIDDLLDNERSLILKQAENRVFAAQAVIKQMLEKNFSNTNEFNNTVKEQVLSK